MNAPILEAIAEEQGGHRPGLLDGFLAKTGLDLSNPTIGSLGTLTMSTAMLDRR
jgi:hypothetical protein